MNDEYRKEAKSEIIHSLHSGATKEAAAGAAGIGRRTLYDWLKADEAFAKSVSDAVQSAIGSVEDALFAAATTPDEKGRYTVVAQIFYLKNRAPDRWSDTARIENATELTVSFKEDDGNNYPVHAPSGAETPPQEQEAV